MHANVKDIVTFYWNVLNCVSCELRVTLRSYGFSFVLKGCIIFNIILYCDMKSKAKHFIVAFNDVL